MIVCRCAVAVLAVGTRNQHQDPQAAAAAGSDTRVKRCSSRHVGRLLMRLAYFFLPGKKPRRFCRAQNFSGSSLGPPSSLLPPGAT